jgi:hypothetical protein
MHNFFSYAQITVPICCNSTSCYPKTCNMLFYMVSGNCRISDKLVSIEFLKFMRLNLLYAFILTLAKCILCKIWWYLSCLTFLIGTFSFKNITSQVPQALLNLNSVNFLYIISWLAKCVSIKWKLSPFFSLIYEFCSD